jgi:hypothetical protein
MLGKLFKHEMRAMARLLLPLFLVLAALTVIDRIVLYLDIFKGTLEVIPGFLTFAYVLAILAVVIVSSVLIIIRFYRNLMTDEGYLMFTLPVKPHQLINSKLLASIVWTVASLLAVAASIFIVASGSFDWADFVDGLRMVLAQIRTEFNGDMTLFIIELIIMMVFGILNNILIIYVSIAIGQLFNGHKVLGSFAAYIGISIALQVIVTVCTGLLGLIFRDSFNDIASVTHILFPLVLVFLLATNAVYYLITNFIFNRKINLE